MERSIVGTKKSRQPNCSKSLNLVQSRQSLTTVRQEIPDLGDVRHLLIIYIHICFFNESEIHHLDMFDVYMYEWHNFDVSCMHDTILMHHTWILGVVSKQLILLRGRIGDSTNLENSLCPQMS